MLFMHMEAFHVSAYIPSRGVAACRGIGLRRGAIQMAVQGGGKRKRRNRRRVKDEPALARTPTPTSSGVTKVPAAAATPVVDEFAGLTEDPTDEEYARTLTLSSSLSSSSSVPMPPPDFLASSRGGASYESKLKPLSGTAEAKRAAYEEKNAMVRYFEELTEPTPAGQEPKVIKLAKTLTWGAVLVLVLIEIFVSVKVGGAPFSLDKVSFGGNKQEVVDKP